MKEIIINEKNSEKIANALCEVQGKAWMRTIRADDIPRIIDKVEKFLPTISRKSLDNTVVHFVNREQFPNKYKGTPYSTQFSMRFYRGTWRIYDIKRENACGSKEFVIILSDTAKAEIIKRIECGR